MFNNYTVLQNLILAPVELKLASKEEATKTALDLLEKIIYAIENTINPKIGPKTKNNIIPAIIFCSIDKFDNKDSYTISSNELIGETINFTYSYDD